MADTNVVEKDKRINTLETALIEAIEALEQDGKYAEDFGILPRLRKVLLSRG